MKKINLIFIFIFLAINGFCKIPADDVVLKAMHDEMTRNARKLEMKGFSLPYFISYILKDIDQYYIAATLGAEVSDFHFKMRFGAIDARVGNYSFDNSNFGSMRVIVTPFATDDDYDSVRNTFWIYTDLAYKHALEEFSKKKAYKERKNIKEKLDDFSKIKPITHIGQLMEPDFDKNLWGRNIRKISEIFKKYPQVKTSAVSLNYYVSNKRYINSENSAFRYGQGFYQINLSAEIQTKDGFTIEDEKTLIFHQNDKLPRIDELTDKAEKFAKQLIAVSKAPSSDVYIGPVLLKGQASGKFFELLLAKNLNNTRQIWTESDTDFWVGDFHDRLGTRIMSGLFSVVDDPTLEKIGDKYLMGHYSIDDQAVKAKKMELVKKGRLVDILTSRAPTAKRKTPNGHGRGFYTMPSAHISNLIIMPETSLTDEKLEEKLILRCSRLGLDYGIIIESFSSFADTFYAYKISVRDKTKKLVKGFEFNGISTRALRDISAASDKMKIYHINPNETPFSIVAPDILVEEVELKKTQKKPEKFPIVKHPYLR